MAHTPLFAKLQSAARAAADASRRRVDVSRVLEERAGSAGLTRRAFLRGAAATGAGVAMGAALPVRAVAQGAPRVAVVGAGLAGLTAAYRLARAGHAVTVYEAQERLGGRCWSLRGAFADGQLAERGGELVDQGHKEFRQLAQELGLDLDNLLAAEPNGTDPFYFFDGAPYTYEEATRDLKAIWQTIHRDVSDASYPTLYTSYTQRGLELDRTSIAQWIEQSVPGGLRSRLGQLLEQAYVIEYGGELADQSALNLLYLIGYSGQGQLRLFGPSNEKYHVRGGNDLVVQRLAAALAGRIETGAALEAIAREPDGRYTLTFARGASTRTVRADKVVLALPFSILRTRVDSRRAQFSAVKETAIREQGMGANTKLQLQFGSRHWNALGNNGDSYADTGYQATWEVTRGQPGAAGILVNYTGGDYARTFERGTAVDQAQVFLRQIEPVLPGLSARWNGRAVAEVWSTNPWSRGAYSYWRVGQYTRFAGAEGERSFDCHFAGEHTSVDFQGYLNGAVETGERAAAEVAADLRLWAR
jgi:monoamine oxidase